MYEAQLTPMDMRLMIQLVDAEQVRLRGGVYPPKESKQLTELEGLKDKLMDICELEDEEN